MRIYFLSYICIFIIGSIFLKYFNWSRRNKRSRSCWVKPLHSNSLKTFSLWTTSVYTGGQQDWSCNFAHMMCTITSIQPSKWDVIRATNSLQTFLPLLKTWYIYSWCHWSSGGSTGQWKCPPHRKKMT